MGSAQSRPPPQPNPLLQNSENIEALVKDLDLQDDRQENQVPDEDKDKMEQDKQSLQVLKTLFKKLDPAVARCPMEVNGKIELSFKFDPKRQLLLTKVIRCKDLHAGDIRTGTSNPYVRLQLYPDQHNHGPKVTKIVVETSEPVYNEIFAFRMRERELESTSLVVQVFDYDSVTTDDVVGEVVVTLSEFDFKEQPVFTAWYTLSSPDNANRVQNDQQQQHQSMVSQEFHESFQAHASVRVPAFLFQQLNGKKAVTVTCRKAGVQGKIRIVNGIPVY